MQLLTLKNFPTIKMIAKYKTVAPVLRLTINSARNIVNTVLASMSKFMSVRATLDFNYTA